MSRALLREKIRERVEFGMSADEVVEGAGLPSAAGGRLVPGETGPWLT